MKQKGFLLLLVIIGLIIVLVIGIGVAYYWGQISGVNKIMKIQTAEEDYARPRARDTQRLADISGILSAVYLYVYDSRSVPSAITTTPTHIGTGNGLVNLSIVLVPKYLDKIPYDPSKGSDADTNYTIYKNGDKLTISAVGEVNANITLTR